MADEAETKDETKDELQAELRRRGLPVSGTKDELRERLVRQGSRARESPPAQTQARTGEPPSGDARGGSSSERPKAGEIARLAARQLGELTRRQVEAVSGLGRDENGWRVEVEVVEVDRVPSSTDVMGTYAVYVDAQGELLSYERVERFVRGQARGGEG